MKTYFAYTRVSTVKQGEGVSLQEQRDAISRYAQRSSLQISDWFEEKETAAKRGRPVFNQMLKRLGKEEANGVVIHKIDRSSRNLKDWADLGELIDQGVEVHFANESLDLHSRGGRLSADIQAVVASDYIRNLREETRKGFYGRIKQGLYPLPAPVGYVDRGKGVAKEIDPILGPLVRKAFELYGTGRYGLDDLVQEMHRLGLRNKRGDKVTRNGFSVVLNNPFYVGLIRLRRTGEMFPGGHRPLIKKSLFDRVQQVLNGKTPDRTQSHNFLFRRLLSCKRCGYSLIGEKQKGRVYYRCHTKACRQTCIREEDAEGAIHQAFRTLELSQRERDYLRERIGRLKGEWGRQEEDQKASLGLRLSQVRDRINRLTDAFVDRVIEQSLFEERKAALLMDRKDLEEQIARLKAKSTSTGDCLTEFLELAESAWIKYKLGLPEEKRDLLKIVTSNRHVDGKNVELMLTYPFCDLAKRSKNSNGSPYRDRPRTWDRFLQGVLKWFASHPDSDFLLESLRAMYHKGENEQKTD